MDIARLKRLLVPLKEKYPHTDRPLSIERQFIVDVEALIQEVEPQMFVCPECGPRVMADEDGCCATCGRDCTIEPLTTTKEQDRG